MNKKAITPVVATVLLLMMAVAAAGTAYFWMVTVQSRIQSDISANIQQQLGGQSYGISLISAYCMSGGSTINVTVQNTGSKNLPTTGYSALTLYNATTGAVLSTVTLAQDSSNCQPNTFGGLAINAMTTCNFTGVTTLSSTDGVEYSLKVTAPGGAEASGSCVTTS